MDSHAISALLVVFFTLSIFPVQIASPPNLLTWCNQTPHPKQCEYHLSHNKNYDLPIQGKSDFLNILIKTALENAKRVHQNAYSLGSNCRNEDEKAAWAHCSELYELAVQHLQLATRTNGCTEDDIQTWLSSALTYVRSCEDGFRELSGGYESIMHPILHANLSCLISNALAINLPKNSSGLGGPWTRFPGWVKPSGRKLLESTSLAVSRPDLVVAQDGSRDFKTIEEAIRAASGRKGKERYAIYIKAGTYIENVEIGSELENLIFLGDGIGKTIITGSKSVGGGTKSTFNTATVAIMGRGFMARSITFRNTAGPLNGQAVALRCESDYSVFYKCSFEGFQDTLYVYANRQFYHDCEIYGTVDFIFGRATVVIQNSIIYVRSHPHGINTITAHGRDNENQTTGISIHKCQVTAADSLVGAKTYLGRPWRNFSRTVFMKTHMDDIIDPKGWLEWNGSFALNTLYYGEYANIGPGSSIAKRVNWTGYHVITNSAEAERFTVENFINGNSWLPSTGVPYNSTL